MGRECRLWAAASEGRASANTPSSPDVVRNESYSHFRLLTADDVPARRLVWLADEWLSSQVRIVPIRASLPHGRAQRARNLTIR